jgi:tight adherence protein C
MDPVLVLTLTLIFIAVVTGVVVTAMLALTRDSGATGISTPRIDEISSQLKNQASAKLTSVGDKFRQKFGGHLPSAFKEDGWQDSKLQQKLAQAGYRTHTTASLLLGATLICTLLGLAGGFIFSLSGITSIQPVGSVLFTLLGAVIGIMIPMLGLELLIRRRQRQLVEHFPDALDLIRICLEAGLGLDAAIQRVGQEFRQVAPALFDEFHVLSLELRAGAGRTRALQNLAQRTGLGEIRSWVTMIIQSEKFGTGIAEAVKIHSDQLRLTRRLNAEQRAATLSTRLLFPLIFCIFPALLLVLLGPAGITIQQQLGHTLEGKQ